ncbi:hypothetical protein [Streptomyces sp. MBT53]|uniref:hypothetical protein n=1 Tax=Streptomyces sp. MBT53 TaxID=1488384 RepID=UPI0019118FF1|nr:hypothetical protein [Streptomyces sp. MBT53]MBK6011427.1 hypothetical protein [Streptomyces sp. MBT53]
MNPSVVAALVGASAALLGAFVASIATRRVEILRLRANLIEKAEDRKLATLEGFLLAVNAWLDWLSYIEQDGWEGNLDELNVRVRARDDAYRRLVLLASDDLHRWLIDVYNPQEYQLKATYVRRLRYGEPLNDRSRELRRSFSRLLRENLIIQFRPEIAALRDPLHPMSQRRWR